MEISFENDELKSVCLARSQPEHLSDVATRKLRALYNAMRNAEHLAELPFGGPEAQCLNNCNEWTTDLDDRSRVRLRVNHLRTPTADGTVSLERVRRVYIAAIEFYHA